MVRRSPAIFLGDALGLDFLNSIATPVDTPVDWIGDGESYLSWLEQAQLVPADVLREMRKRALPGELDSVADQARSLREWFRGFVRQRMGRPLTTEALGELKRSIACSSATRSSTGSLPPKRKEPFDFRPRALAPPARCSCPSGRRSSAGLVRRTSPRQGLAKARPVRCCLPITRGATPAVVQHGDVRQSREAGGPPTLTKARRR
jgi:hypothetical protein